MIMIGTENTDPPKNTQYSLYICTLYSISDKMIPN